MKIINRENAEHYRWKTVCDGWHFVKSDALSIIAEKMPPRRSNSWSFPCRNRTAIASWCEHSYKKVRTCICARRDVHYMHARNLANTSGGYHHGKLHEMQHWK